VKVHYDEDLAGRIGPAPCVVFREGQGEASAGERAGWPLSRGNALSRVPTASPGRRQHALLRYRERWDGPARSETPACMDASCCSGTERSHPWPAAQAAGSRREGEEPKPATHKAEKSDLAIVAVKPANKSGPPDAEGVEPRAGPREMWASYARAGHRTGQAWHSGGTAYGKLRGKRSRQVHSIWSARNGWSGSWSTASATAASSA